jgi:hypothetical protein
MKRVVLAFGAIGFSLIGAPAQLAFADEVAPPEPPAVVAPPPTTTSSTTAGPAVTVAAPAPTTDDGTPAKGFSWGISGDLRVISSVVQNDPNVQFIGRADGFKLQDALLALHGRYGERIAVEFSVDAARDERVRANSPNGELQFGVHDAFADLALGQRLTGLSLRIGRFKIMADPDHMIATTQRAFVDRSLMSRGVRATEGWETEGLAPGRSNGAAFRMDPGPVTSGVKPGFELAVQNGADELASANDNDAFAISLAGFLRLPNNGFVLASGRWNPRTIGDLPLRKDQTDIEAAVSGMYRIGPVEIVGGFMLRNTTFDTTGGPSQTAFGVQAQGMYYLGTELPLAIGYRFGIMDPSNLVLTDRVMEHTGGMMLQLPRLRSRVQLNFTHVAEQAERQLSNDRVEAVYEVAL